MKPKEQKEIEDTVFETYADAYVEQEENKRKKRESLISNAPPGTGIRFIYAIIFLLGTITFIAGLCARDSDAATAGLIIIIVAGICHFIMWRCW